MNWAQLMIDFATKQAVRVARNYASELCICPIVSAKDDGSDATIRWNGVVIGSDLVVQTPFTIENVVEVPEQDSPRHYHKISSNLVDRVGITATGESVLFLPSDMDLSGVQNPDGTFDMAALSQMIENIDPTNLTLAHDHGGKTSRELPKVRLWRGVKAGDEVLVMKINPSCFLILCRLVSTNDKGAQEVEVYNDSDPSPI